MTKAKIRNASILLAATLGGLAYWEAVAIRGAQWWEPLVGVLLVLALLVPALASCPVD